MKVYIGRIPAMSHEILDSMINGEHIEVLPEMLGEVELDITSVLREYVRVERDITDRGRDMIADQGLPYNHLFKIKKRLAADSGFGIGDDSIDYLSTQIIELMLHTRHVDEVFSEDHEIRKTIRPMLRRHMAMDSELDMEVRNRIKNLQEGTSDWEVEYKKVMEQVKSAQKLT